MTMDYSRLSLLAATVSLADGLLGGSAAAIDVSRLDITKENPNDWLTYHGSYKSWHYSALDQINTSNIDRAQSRLDAFTGRTTRGLQSFPLVADGVLYYSGSYSRLFALDAATGQVLWSYIPELNEDLVAAQTHTPLQSRHRAGTRPRLRRHGRWPADRR